MDRQYFTDIARNGLRMPIGTDLLLHEHANHEQIRLDGDRMARVIVDAAKRYRTPLAVPQMDLTREKSVLLELMGIDSDGEYHFTAPPTEQQVEQLHKRLRGELPRVVTAHIDAIRRVSGISDLVSVGMVIGPFSLMTKLLSDPITPVYLAGTGATVAEEPEIAVMESALKIAVELVLELIRRQIDAGAKVMMIAEPAANKVYFSPTQLDSGSDVYDRYAIAPNQAIRKLLAAYNVDLFFHCCGELTDTMLRKFTTLDPAILSLGSSRKLWEDAAIVPESTVLFGNLPSKQFYSDALISVTDVGRRSSELIGRMKDVKHPFILGSECDVLHVAGCEHTIRAKVQAMLGH
jgi:uroporphyrinogen-III decarboxylase